MNTIWQQILHYQSYDMIASSYLQKHNRKISAGKITQIASNFIQAREYFLNAEKSSFSVKPLLLYYGVLGLARGMILMLSPKQTESSMKQSHGLSTLKWKETLSQGLTSIKDLIVSINEGTFSELILATENKVYLKHNSSIVNSSVIYANPSSGIQFSFKELVKVIPDLIGEYQEWSKEKSHLSPLKSLKVEGQTVHITIEKTKYFSEKSLETLFPGGSIKDDGRDITITTTKAHYPYLTQQFQCPFEVGIVYISKEITDSLALSPIAILYCLSYYLGMLARYFPSIWVSLDKISKGDRVYPLIQKIMDLIFNEFPKLTVDYLKGPYEFES